MDVRKLEARLNENLECLVLADNQKLFDYLKHEVAKDITLLYEMKLSAKADVYVQTYGSVLCESKYK